MILDDLRQVMMPPDDRPHEVLWRTAVHEAGHAVSAHRLGIGRVTGVSLAWSEHSGGMVNLDLERHLATRGAVEDLVIHTLSGRAAEEICLGSPGTGSGGSPDSDLAKSTKLVGLLHLGTGLGTELLYRAGSDEVAHVLAVHPRVSNEVEKELRRLYARALALLEGEKVSIERVARELVERRYMDGESFLALYGGEPDRLPEVDLG